MTVVGILHPGEMGAAFGAVLHDAGHTVQWVSTGRSDGTRGRAAAAGLVDADSLDVLATGCDVINLGLSASRRPRRRTGAASVHGHVRRRERDRP